MADPFFRRRSEFGEREAWMWLVSAAAVRAGSGVFGRPVNRGEIDVSENGLSMQWGWTVGHVDRFLARLESAAMIIRHGNVVSIVDFDHMTAPASDEPPETAVELLSAADLKSMGVTVRDASRPPIPPAVRREVEARDGRACRYCPNREGPFHLDHVRPWSRGGRSIASNLVVACESCNLSKGARTPAEWRAGPE